MILASLQITDGIALRCTVFFYNMIVSLKAVNNLHEQV